MYLVLEPVKTIEHRHLDYCFQNFSMLRLSIEVSRRVIRIV
jgi:hypothetical protein